MIIEQDGFTFEVNEYGSAAVKGYKGGSTSPVIPWDIDGYPVEAIGDWAFGRFFGANPITRITIPEYITHIGAFAFSNCARLESINIPPGVTVLRDRLFDGCRSLTRVRVHDGITAIGKGAFAGCRSLTSVTLPSGITRIEYETFRECKNLAKINIHENIEYIGNYAFSGCNRLSHITLPDTVSHIGSKDAFWPGTVIRGGYGSYAEQYAKRHFFAFEPEYTASRETMMQALLKIKAAQGEGALKNPRIFRGLVSDFLPGGGKNAGYRNILCTSVEGLNIYEVLSKAKTSGDTITANRLTYSLVNLGYQENLAKETVLCFEKIIN
jgi:hypothetical protein